MKLIIISLLCIVAMTTCVVLFGQPAVSQTGPNGTLPEKLTNLLIERRDALRQIADWVESRHRNGNETLENLMQARNELLEAELEVAKTRTERIRIREEQVSNVRLLEDRLSHLRENGEISAAEVLVAKAARLKAEIELLRE